MKKLTPFQLAAIEKSLKEWLREVRKMQRRNREIFDDDDDDEEEED